MPDVVDYANLLSLDRAKLQKRSRLNFLGSKELILNYNLQTSGAKEDATQWLESNRLTLTDPKFGFKTYTGVWESVDISFNEDAKVIQQRLKIDAPILYDVAKRDISGETLRSYYFRIVDPEKYILPKYITTGSTLPALHGLRWFDSGIIEEEAAVFYDQDEIYANWWDGSKFVITLIGDVGSLGTDYFWKSGREGSYAPAGGYSGNPLFNLVGNTGEVWSKRINDNGDGTYDVTIEYNIAESYEGVSYGQSGLWGELTTVTINDDEQAAPAWSVGEIVTVNNVPLENGKFRTTTTTRTAIKQVIAKSYPHDYLAAPYYPKITVARNHTEAELDALIAGMSVVKVNSVSMSINEFGLYDAIINERFD